MLVARRLSLSIVACLLFAGCAEQGTDEGVTGAGSSILATPIGEALWNDPQLFPHPAYGWPTITSVPKDAPAWWQPIPARPLPDGLVSLEHLAQAGGGSAGDGIAI